MCDLAITSILGRRDANIDAYNNSIISPATNRIKYLWHLAKSPKPSQHYVTAAAASSIALPPDQCCLLAPNSLSYTQKGLFEGKLDLAGRFQETLLWQLYTAFFTFWPIKLSFSRKTHRNQDLMVNSREADVYICAYLSSERAVAYSLEVSICDIRGILES